MFKSMFFYFIAALAFQVSSQAYLAQYGDINDDIAKALEALKDAINTQINATEDVILGLEDDFQKTAKTILDTANANVNNAFDKAIDKITQYEQDAIANGLDISGCLELKNELESIPNDTTTLNQGCLDTVSAEIKNKTEAIFDDIRNFTTIIDDLQKEADDCSIINPLCLTELLAKIVADTASIPSQIIDYETDVKTMLADATSELSACTLENVENALDDITEVSNDLIQCYLNAPKLTTSVTETSSSEGTTGSTSEGTTNSDGSTTDEYSSSSAWTTDTAWTTDSAETTTNGHSSSAWTTDSEGPTTNEYSSSSEWTTDSDHTTDDYSTSDSTIDRYTGTLSQ